MDLGNSPIYLDKGFASSCFPFLLLLFMAPDELWSSTRPSESLTEVSGVKQDFSEGSDGSLDLSLEQLLRTSPRAQIQHQLSHKSALSRGGDTPKGEDIPKDFPLPTSLLKGGKK